MATQVNPRLDGQRKDVAIAEAAVLAHRALNPGTDPQKVKHSAGTGTIGVSLNGAAAGKEVEYVEAGTGWCKIEAGGTITAGAEFKLDSVGRAVALSGDDDYAYGVLHPRQAQTGTGVLAAARLYGRPQKVAVTEQRVTLQNEDLADNKTATLNFLAPPSGAKWLISRVRIGSTARTLATAQVKVDGTNATAAPTSINAALVDVTTFTTAVAAAGEAVTVVLATGETTGKLEGIVVQLVFSEVPA